MKNVIYVLIIVVLLSFCSYMLFNLYSEKHQNNLVSFVEPELSKEESENHRKAKAYYKKGKQFLKKNQYEEAIEQFHQAIELRPNHYLTLFKLALSYHDAEQCEQAIKYYRKAGSIKPKKSSVHFNIGNCYYDLKEYDKALDSYEKSLELNPNDIDTKVEIAKMHVIQKNYQQAFQLYETLLGSQVNQQQLGSIHNSVGLGYSKVGIPNKAIKHYQLAQKANPQSLYPYRNLGNEYYKIEEYSLAIEQYQLALKIGGQEEYLNEKLAKSTEKLEQESSDKSQVDTTSVSKSSPIENYPDSEEYKNGVAEYKAKIAETPENVENYVVLGLHYRRGRDFKRAVDVFQQALDIEPDLPHVTQFISKVYLRIKDYEKALDFAQKTTELEPQNARGYLNQAISYHFLGHFEKSDQALLKMVENSVEMWGGTYVMFFLAWVEPELKEDARIIKAAETIVALKPDDGWAVIHAAGAYSMLGLHRKELQLYEKALKKKKYPLLATDPVNLGLHQGLLEAQLINDEPLSADSIAWLNDNYPRFTMEIIVETLLILQRIAQSGESLTEAEKIAFAENYKEDHKTDYRPWAPIKSWVNNKPDNEHLLDALVFFE